MEYHGLHYINTAIISLEKYHGFHTHTHTHTPKSPGNDIHHGIG